MKSFLVYVKGHEKSEFYMKKAFKSCEGKGFNVEPLEGVTPATLDNWEQYPEILNGRSSRFKLENDKIYRTKKSCFINHVRIWKKCVELDEPVAFIEQDSTCIREWNGQIFDELLIMNVESAFKQKVFSHVKNKPFLNLGLNWYNQSPLSYRFDNEFKNSLLIPGTAAYAVSPKGAKKLLNTLERYGWDQSDFFINTKTVNIQYIVPEYFTFELENLNMSHGF